MARCSEKVTVEREKERTNGRLAFVLPVRASFISRAATHTENSPPSRPDGRPAGPKEPRARCPFKRNCRNWTNQFTVFEISRDRAGFGHRPMSSQRGLPPDQSREGQRKSAVAARKLRPSDPGRIHARRDERKREMAKHCGRPFERWKYSNSRNAVSRPRFFSSPIPSAIRRAYQYN